MKLKIYAGIIFVTLFCAAGAFAWKTDSTNAAAASPNNSTAEMNTSDSQALKKDTQLSENVIIKFSGGYQYVLMTNFNNMLYTNAANLSASYTNKTFTQTNTGIFGEFEIDYKANSLYVGPKIGYLYCLPAAYGYRYNPTATTFKADYALSLIPLEIGVGYELDLSKATGGTGVPFAFDFSIYSGYSWATFSMKAVADNNATYGDYTRTINYYGEGISSDINAGFKYVDMTGTGIRAGINFGYKYAMIPYVKTDMDYSVITSNGRVLTTYKNTAYSNYMNFDFRGITVSIDLGYAF